jgi:hypothetical protein
MAITQTLTALTNVPSTSDPTNFAAEADSLLGTQLPALITEINTFGTQANALATALNAVATGGAMSIAYTFSTTTTDADPGAGVLRLNQATQNTSTVIRLDLLDVAGTTWTSAYDLFDDSTSTVKGFIKLQKQSDGSKWLLFSVSALASPSGYRNVTVSCVASSAASPFSNGDTIELEFTRNGDKGDTGADAWAPPTAWLTATAYTATAPKSVVTTGGETYVCLTSHTSGTFATDLAAVKWIKVAAKGTDGAASSIPVVVIIDRKASTTAGQQLVAGARRKLNLNTFEVNLGSLASVASDVMTLPAGNYCAAWECQLIADENTGSDVESSMTTFLRDTTAGADLGQGTTVHGCYFTTLSVATGGVSCGFAKFTLSGTSNVQLEGISQTVDWRNGKAAGITSTFEIYNRLKIWLA